LLFTHDLSTTHPLNSSPYLLLYPAFVRPQRFADDFPPIPYH